MFQKIIWIWNYIVPSKYKGDQFWPLNMRFIILRGSDTYSELYTTSTRFSILLRLKVYIYTMNLGVHMEPYYK